MFRAPVLHHFALLLEMSALKSLYEGQITSSLLINIVTLQTTQSTNGPQHVRKKRKRKGCWSPQDTSDST